MRWRLTVSWSGRRSAWLLPVGASTPPLNLGVRPQPVATLRTMAAYAISAGVAVVGAAVLTLHMQATRATVAVGRAAGELRLDLGQFSGPEISGTPFVSRVFHWKRRSGDTVELLDYLSEEEVVCWTTVSRAGVAMRHGCVAAGGAT